MALCTHGNSHLVTITKHLLCTYPIGEKASKGEVIDLASLDKTAQDSFMSRVADVKKMNELRLKMGKEAVVKDTIKKESAESALNALHALSSALPSSGCANPLCTTPSSPPPTLSQCARCRTVAYCSRPCQVDHWKVHKTACSKKE